MKIDSIICIGSLIIATIGIIASFVYMVMGDTELMQTTLNTALSFSLLSSIFRLTS